MKAAVMRMALKLRWLRCLIETAGVGLIVYQGLLDSWILRGNDQMVLCVSFWGWFIGKELPKMQ